ncbi:hypothetical protein VTN00DRAFT_4484 [Thermoascus crustaceus]|uniref:uncharacterized protein n=1 Tax=Thermoascus crustaceus TaxID=5088 RepID=UPI0037449196
MKPWVGNIALGSSTSRREGKKKDTAGVKVLTFSTTGSDKRLCYGSTADMGSSLEHTTVAPSGPGWPRVLRVNERPLSGGEGTLQRPRPQRWPPACRSYGKQLEQTEFSRLDASLACSSLPRACHAAVSLFSSPAISPATRRPGQPAPRAAHCPPPSATAFLPGPISVAVVARPDLGEIQASWIFPRFCGTICLPSYVTYTMQIPPP